MAYPGSKSVSLIECDSVQECEYLKLCLGCEANIMHSSFLLRLISGVPLTAQEAAYLTPP